MSYNAELLKFAHELADSVQKLITKNFRNLSDWTIKPSNHDRRPQVLTDTDIECEKIMRNLINKNFPQHGIIGEELGTENEESEFVWVLDPIDGTKAFVSGLPVFGSMIGLMKNKLPIIGLIDQPITKERIWGSDQGSYLNGKIINTRKCKSIKKAICAITDPSMFINEQEIYIKIIQNTFFIRHGTDCWGYAMCASGFIDLVIEKDLEIWDIVAAIPIINAAGGKITSWEGKNPIYSGSIIAAGDPNLHSYLIEFLKNK